VSKIKKSERLRPAPADVKIKPAQKAAGMPLLAVALTFAPASAR
jgi:hypothetical protein